MGNHKGDTVDDFSIKVGLWESLIHPTFLSKRLGYIRMPPLSLTNLSIDGQQMLSETLQLKRRRYALLF